MKIKLLYQTLEDRGNPDHIEANAPFHCNWKNAWLGDGYYFWDTFIENAHWWGSTRYGTSYVICRGICDFSSHNCFDLVGDTEHMQDFSAVIDLLKERKKIDGKTTVATVITFLKNKVGFSFEAIRVYGIQSISSYKSEYERYVHRLPFELNKVQYLDYKPAIQLCLFKSKSLNLRDLRIEFPDEYNVDFVV